MDEPCVTTRPMLRPSTFRVFRAKAEQMGTTVDVLLSRMADAAVKPRGKAARAAASAQLDKQIAALNAAGKSDNAIARQLGLTLSTASRRRNALGLPKVGRGGRPRKTVTEDAA
jgi:hypothetical protein